MAAQRPGDEWDPGAQPERTRLAWQRTALSGLACSLVVAKLVAARSPVLGTVLAGLAVLTTGAVMALSVLRYLRSNEALLHHTRLPGPGMSVATTVLAVLTGLGAGVYALSELARH